VGWVEDKIEHLAATVALEGERTRAELATAFAQTQRGLRVDGALARPIVPNAVNYNSGRRLVGWSLRASAGDVVINLRDGHDAGGDVIGSIALAAGQSQTKTLMPAGVAFVEGLYVEATGAGAAAVVGALWIGAVD
jgi:hypothetical protein